MTDKEKELLIENEKLKKEIKFLKEKIENYRRMEMEHSNEKELLRKRIKK